MRRGSPFRYISLRTNLLLLLAFFVVGGFFIVLQSPPGGSNGVAAATMRGGRMLVVRPPQVQQSVPPEQIMVFDDNVQLSPRLATRAPIHVLGHDHVQEIHLSAEQWSAINRLRQRWCDTSPRFSPDQEDTGVYDIGIRCSYAFGISTRQIRVPERELPAEIQQLFVLFSGPTFGSSRWLDHDVSNRPPMARHR